MIKNNIKIVFVFLFIVAPYFITNSSAVGMGMGMGGGIPCGGPFPPCPIPLDSGVLLLLFAGAFYGGKKIYDSIKKNPA